MRYTIYSVDDSRFQYKLRMRSRLRAWEEIEVTCVDGRNREELDDAISKRRVKIVNPDMRVGQLGVWHTFLNAIEHAPLVTFDDDALLCENFTLNVDIRIGELPDDADFLSLFLPRYFDQDSNPRDYIGKYLTKIYAPYGGVSLYFSERGVENILALVERDGIQMQYDNQLYRYAKAGELNGYCSRPDLPDLVYITENELSIAQETEIYHG